MSYWQEYNEKLSEFSQKLIEHNEKNSFNAVETSFYPHVRDILGLTLTLIYNNQEKKQIKVLDYGSNETVWVNFKNKINTNFLDIFIYDPFIQEGKESGCSRPCNVRITSNLQELKQQRYDLVVFGSVAQYDSKFILDWKNNRRIDTEYILFTHTPLSTSSGFSSKQFSDYKGLQTVHAYDELLEKLKSESFDLIFKSTLDSKYACVEEQFMPITVYANLLFKKNLSLEE